MKKTITIILSMFLLFSFVSCGSTPVAESEQKEAPVTEEVLELDDAEYERSLKQLKDKSISIPKEQVAKDKNDLLKIIEQLEIIMEEQDFQAWLNYIAPASKKFYSKPRRILQNQKIVVNNGLEDYFLNIFIKAREKSKIDEIRYVSPTSIKAVEVTGPNNILTYYNFTKIEDKWYVVLPTDIVLK